MNNLELYNKLRSVPANAKKPISAGRLKGMTDINPMYRIKALTDTFGAVGTGWWYTIEKMWTEPAGDEVAAFVNINLYYKYNGETSQAVPGTGGSMFAASEAKGIHVSDECYKMALTDAISVAAKALGVGADVYWQNDASSTKYTATAPAHSAQEVASFVCTSCGEIIKPVTYKGEEYPVRRIATISAETYGRPMCWNCMRKAKSEKEGAGDAGGNT